MNTSIMNASKMLLLMTLSSLFLMACGPGKTVDPPAIGSSSSHTPMSSTPVATKETPVRIHSFSANQSTATKINLGGSILIDYTDTSVTDIDSVSIGNIEFQVGLLENGQGYNIGANVEVLFPPQFPVERAINLTELGASVDISAFDVCGEIFVDIVVYSGPVENTSKYRSVERVTFIKDPNVYCKEPESSSSSVEAPKIEMESYQATLTTSKTSGHVAISFETGQVFTYSELATGKDLIDAVLVWENGFGILKSARTAGMDGYTALTGGRDTKFGEEYNANDNYSGSNVPPPVYADVFTYKSVGMTEVDYLSFGTYYVVQTVDYNSETQKGFFAFMIAAEQKGKNDLQLILTVYKVK